MEENKYEITNTNSQEITQSDYSTKNNNISSQNDCRDLVVTENNSLTTGNEKDCIVIKKEELNTAYVNDRINEELEAKVDFNKTERIPVQNNILLNPIFYSAICGLVAAFIGWAISEPFLLIKIIKETLKYKHLVFDFMIVSIGMFVSCSLSSIDSLMSANFKKALKLGAIGLGLSLVFSGTLYWALNYLYKFFVNFNTSFFTLLFKIWQTKAADIATTILYMVSRAPVWAMFGGGIGMIPGIANKSKKLAINGIIGGLIGGFLGGFIFDPIYDVISTNYSTAGLSRGIGFSILGLMIGVFIGLIENVSKDVWITMKSGPLRGKQFVIYHNPTFIGSSPKSDIYIFKDPNVMPIHAKIQKKGTKYEIIDESRGHGVFVNSKKINGSKVLEPNDRIVIGKSILEFHQKEKR